jgi:hypothetical protein
MLPAAAAVSFETQGGQCLQTVGFDSTSYWVLQLHPCSEDALAQRFIVKDGIQQNVGSKIESLTPTSRCLSYSLGAPQAPGQPRLAGMVALCVCCLLRCILHYTTAHRYPRPGLHCHQHLISQVVKTSQS